MFKRLLDYGEPTVTVIVDGKSVRVRAGDSVASIFLCVPPFHARTSPVSGAERAPFCMMGVCFECLAIVDGVASTRSCQLQVRQGMRIERQQGPRRLCDD